MSIAASPPHRHAVISALGVAQIFAWGTSFYFPAVFAAPIVRETAWPLEWVVGGTSLGLLVAGLASPKVGAVVDVHGGRPVLLTSSLCYAAGLSTIGIAPSLAAYFAGWLLIGLGMGTGLYDAVFAALGRMYGAEARGQIATLTLFGGFASTVCWPLSALMIDHIGWRALRALRTPPCISCSSCLFRYSPRARANPCRTCQPRRRRQPSRAASRTKAQSFCCSPACSRSRPA